jgi:guanyl-specific ribonuclease Sa
MRKLKWIVTTILIALLAAAVLAGCGGSGANSAAPQTSQAETVSVTETASLQEYTETEGPETAELTQDDTEAETESAAAQTEAEGLSVAEDGTYTSKDEVALYLHTYGHLPDNYITKNEARDLGWDSKAGNLADVAPGMSIGGDRFGNYEGLLPDADGRKFFECDIDYSGGRRNSKRIIFSNDGLVFYTDDHYKSFTQLY